MRDGRDKPNDNGDGNGRDEPYLKTGSVRFDDPVLKTGRLQREKAHAGVRFGAKEPSSLKDVLIRLPETFGEWMRDGRKRLYVLVGVGALLLLVIATAVVSSGSGEDEGPSLPGCGDDAACGAGRICLNRGCVLLISSEYAGLWHSEVEAQLTPGTGWKPRSDPGEKLPPAVTCPAIEGEVPEPRIRKMSVVAKTHVYELGPERIRHYQYQRAKGSVWIDALRFHIPTGEKLDAARLCQASGVARVAPGKDVSGRAVVDIALGQASPAGVDAKGAVSLSVAPKEGGSPGERVISFDLEPVIGDEKQYRTVLAVPLGADILGINGPPPAEQRLLKGFVAYYWHHKGTLTDVSVTYRLPGAVSPQPLDYTSVRP